MFSVSSVSPYLQDASTDLYPPIGRNKPHVDLGTLMTITSRPKKILKTTNAYFYWVTREQGSFDWFKGVMNEIADLDQRVNRPIVFFPVQFICLQKFAMHFLVNL